MAVPVRHNAGKPWTPEDLDLLRNLASSGATTGQIAERLGRSRLSVSKAAEKLRISVGEKSTTRLLGRRWGAPHDPEDPSTS
jgi:hypothetical protein